ncbi:MAG: galactokinase family protein [Eubacteriales bacterium]|nr:galactokinase family protein [Eubacteriales bacterium]
MPQGITVSTPSRLCLFGEHLDYLGLEVVAMAIDLRFYARVHRRQDGLLRVHIRDSNLKELGNTQVRYVEKLVDINEELVYTNSRDYFKSSLRTLARYGVDIRSGFDVVMDSQIPIGKGMCSSTTMIMALLKALMECTQADGRDDPDVLAELGFRAEVEEFGEPGGRMDHYTSAYGGLVHLDFGGGITTPRRLCRHIPGRFILFDSLTSKDTLSVLSSAKEPVLAGLAQLKPRGIHSIRDLAAQPGQAEHLAMLDELHRRKVRAAADNYAILHRALALLERDDWNGDELGTLLNCHHANLRDGLGISTPVIEEILSTALAHGAYGGKINGSGGGGCCFVYCAAEKADDILRAVQALGYPGRVLRMDEGTRVER